MRVPDVDGWSVVVEIRQGRCGRLDRQAVEVIYSERHRLGRPTTDSRTIRVLAILLALVSELLFKRSILMKSVFAPGPST